MYTKCCMCVWNWACGCVFCLCCMHSLNPLLKLDTAQYRHRCHSSQVTLLPLSPLPPLTSLPIFSFFLPSLHFICSPSPFSSFLLPLSCSLCLLSSSELLLILLQPLMTCLKPTGSTVREGTEALPSHRPSRRAAALGKVHTQNMCAHSNNTHKVSRHFPVGKNGCTHNYRWFYRQECSGERCVYARVCDCTLTCT